jgi:predicted nucleic acid-binding protein
MMILPATLRKESRRIGRHGIHPPGISPRLERPDRRERRKLTPEQAIEAVQNTVGDIPIVLCALTIAEVGHGIYRANTPEIRARRRLFLDERKATMPIHSVTEVTAEIIARIGGEQAARGVNLPLGDLIIGACALELGYAVGTSNVRDFARIPDLSIIHL